MINNFIGFYRGLDKKFKAIFWVAFIDFVIIIALGITFFIYQLNNKSSNITITNWDEYASNVPNGYKQSAEQTISNILIKYNKAPADLQADAIIRSDTYYNNEDEGNYNVGFIIDIASLEQSYKVGFDYTASTSKNSEFQVDVSCPSYTQVIYKNTKCATSSNPFNEVSQYLTYLDYLPESQARIIIEKQSYGSDKEHPNSPYLAVSVNSCDDFSIVEEAKAYVPTWLKERLLDPNDFYYEVFNTCEN